MPLIYRDRGTSNTQLDIVCGNVVVGNLWKAVLSVTAGEAVHWNWTFHAGPAAGPQMHGSADSREEAKAKIEALWAAWLDAAGLVERKPDNL